MSSAFCYQLWSGKEFVEKSMRTDVSHWRRLRRFFKFYILLLQAAWIIPSCVQNGFQKWLLRFSKPSDSAVLRNFSHGNFKTKWRQRTTVNLVENLAISITEVLSKHMNTRNACHCVVRKRVLITECISRSDTI